MPEVAAEKVEDSHQSTPPRTILEQARKLAQEGQTDHAAALLKKSSRASREDTEENQMLISLQKAQDDDLLVLCRKATGAHDEIALKRALQILHERTLSANVLESCLDSISSPRQWSAVTDQLTAAILSHAQAQDAFIQRLIATSTPTFRSFWRRGPKTARAVISLVQAGKGWPTQKALRETRQDIFRLLEAETISPGFDQPEKAFNSISAMISIDPEMFVPMLDDDCFSAYLPYLAEDQPHAVRSQITLLMATCFAQKPEATMRLTLEFFVLRSSRQAMAEKALAVQIAASIFQVSQDTGRKLFLDEKNLELMKAMIGLPDESRICLLSVLLLLNAACIDRECRKMVIEKFIPCIENFAHDSTSRIACLAMLVLMKCQASEDFEDKDKDQIKTFVDVEGLIPKLKDLLTQSTPHEELLQEHVIEALAIASLKTSVKARISDDSELLKALLDVLASPETGPMSTYGTLSTVANLVCLPKVQSEEQQQVQQIRAYANRQKGMTQNQSEVRRQAGLRGKKVLAAGIVTALAGRKKAIRGAMVSTVAEILSSLSAEKQNRGVMAQQGSVSLILDLEGDYNKRATSEGEDGGRRTLAHALARILISTNPMHIFTDGRPSVTSAIALLVTLLTIETVSGENYRDLLPTFESLLALTNLASMEDEVAREWIVRSAWTQLESLVLESNVLVRRAAVELVCNLMMSPAGIAKFADSSPQARHRMHVLLALGDVEDFATRRAAGGALAMLTEWDAVVAAVVSFEIGVRILLSWCQDSHDEMRHRGAVCIQNLTACPGKPGEQARAKIEDKGGIEILEELIKSTKDAAVLSPANEALQALRSMR